MQYTTIENTNLKVSRLAFGTASLHHLFRRSQRQRLLAAAFASGITHFDTSPYYGYGLAESDVGLFIRGRRDAVTVATKVGLYAPGSTNSIMSIWARKAAGKFFQSLSVPRIDWGVQTAERSLNASLKRLKTEYVDVLFLHEPDPTLINSDEFLTWLESERAKGKVRYWGLAGVPDRFGEWILINHPLSTIVQSKDSLDRKEADIVLRQERRLQFTYGYLSSSTQGMAEYSADTLLRKALQRNTDGSVLFSTRRLERIEKLAGIVA